MERSGALVLFLAGLLLIKPCLCGNGKVKLLSSVTASKGSCVLVPCQTTPYSDLSWYKYQRSGYPPVYSTKGEEVIEEFVGRTSVQGKASGGNCTLRIDNVQQLHEGLGVYVYVHQESFYDPYTVIHVVKPVIQMTLVNRTQVEGRVFKATCQIRHSCPTPPLMEWMGFVPESREVANTEVENGFWSVVATATFRANHQDQGRSLSCRSVLGDGTTAPSNGVQLNILYGPKNVEVVYRGQSEVHEGGDIELTCNSSSKPVPSESNYQWLVTPKNITIRGKGRTVNLQGVRRKTFVSCVVWNIIGQQQSERVSLKVNYPPSILLNSSCSDLDGSLRCECRAEAQPTPNLSWMVDEQNAISPEFNITTYNNGSMAVLELVGHRGNVTCQATNYLGMVTFQLPIHSALMEGRNSVLLAASVGAAVVFSVLVIFAVAFICMKKRQDKILALEKGRGGTARIHINLDSKRYSESYEDYGNNTYLKTHHDQNLDPDDDIYINAAAAAQDPADESCLYENFG